MINLTVSSLSFAGAATAAAATEEKEEEEEWSPFEALKEIITVAVSRST
jgi:hypothetical protein